MWQGEKTPFEIIFVPVFAICNACDVMRFSFGYTTACRPKPSNSNNYLSKIDDDLARKSGQRNNSTVDNALLVVTPSNVMRDTHVSNLSELTTSIKQIIEAQMRQQPIEDKCDVILQQILSSKDELTVLHQHMKQILYKNDGELPQPLDVLNESMRALTNELKSSNAEYRESISNLKVCQSSALLSFCLRIHALPSHNMIRCRQRMSGKHYRLNLAMNG